MRDGRRGAALFIVLVFSAFLAGLAAVATRTGLSGARAAAAFADGIRADELGRGAGAALAYRLATGDEAARRGGAVALRLPGADVTIDYLSESARVDANLAPVPLIVALASAAGADPGEAGALAARVMRFRAEAAARSAPPASPDDAGAGGVPAGGLAALRASVDALGPARKPPPSAQTAALHDTAEVASAWGLPDALARRLLPLLTVSNGTATVDPVLAGRTVVLALVGGDERADDYLRRRRQGFVDKDSALALLPVPSRDFVAFKDVPAVRAVARVRLADRFERRYEMILAPPPEAAPGAGPAGAAPAPAAAPPRQGRKPVPVVVAWRKLP